MIHCIKKVHQKQCRVKDWSILYFSYIFGDKDSFFTVATTPACTSRVSSSPVVITYQSTTDYNSSVRACTAIFAPDHPRVGSLPISPEFLAAQDNVGGLPRGAFQALSLQIDDHRSFLICGSKCVSWWVSYGMQPLDITLNTMGRSLIKRLAACSTSGKTKLVGIYIPWVGLKIGLRAAATWRQECIHYY